MSSAYPSITPKKAKQHGSKRRRSIDQSDMAGSRGWGSEPVSSAAAWSSTRPVTHLEKRQLIQRITSLSDEKLADVVGIIEKFNPQFDTGDDDEEDMEIDFEALNTETLRHLQHYITSLTIKKKKKRCGLPKLRGTLTELEAAQEVEAQIKAIIEQKRTELDALDEALDALDDIETLDALDSIEDEDVDQLTGVWANDSDSNESDSFQDYDDDDDDDDDDDFDRNP